MSAGYVEDDNGMIDEQVWNVSTSLWSFPMQK